MSTTTAIEFLNQITIAPAFNSDNDCHLKTKYPLAPCYCLYNLRVNLFLQFLIKNNKKFKTVEKLEDVSFSYNYSFKLGENEITIPMFHYVVDDNFYPITNRFLEIDTGLHQIYCHQTEKSSDALLFLKRKLKDVDCLIDSKSEYWAIFMEEASDPTLLFLSFIKSLENHYDSGNPLYVTLFLLFQFLIYPESIKEYKGDKDIAELVQILYEFVKDADGCSNTDTFYSYLLNSNDECYSHFSYLLREAIGLEGEKNEQLLRSLHTYTLNANKWLSSALTSKK